MQMRNFPEYGHYLQIEPDLELYYEDKGEGDPLLLIPGITMTTEVFARQFDYFSKKRRVITLDPRSQGRSSKVLHGNNYAQHGRDLDALVRALDLKNTCLVGWSTGNFDVWSYIDQFGLSRVKQVVTIDMSPKPLSQEPGDWVEMPNEALPGVLLDLLANAKGQRDFFAGYAREAMLEHPSDEEVSKIVDLTCMSPVHILHTLLINVLLCDYRTTVKKIEDAVPSLMFIAKHWSDVAEPYMKRHFPKTRTVVMGGHMMFYEYATEWNKVLEEFLDN